jgi:amidase
MNHVVHAFGDDALGHDDAVGIAARITAGEISALEATDAAIARVTRVDDTLGAVAYAAFDEARAAARRSRPGADGPFAGVPSFLKDNVELAGMPACHGSAAIDPVPMRHSNGPAEQFVAQGFVILGKSAMPEFGLTASTEFADGTATHNPWNPGYSAGASSGGAAALVASGAVPIAHGNDGGGSIRIPAAANGLVGLKTTRGRTRDRRGARQLPVNLSAEGALCRTVRDAAHHLAAMERTYANHRLPPVGLVTGPGSRRLRIGFARVSPTGVAVDPATLAQAEATADLLDGLGHHVDEVTLPTGRHFTEDFTLFWALMAVVMARSEQLGHRGHFHRERLDPVTLGLQAKWHANRWATLGAIRRLRRARADYDAMFVAHDVVLSPTLNLPTPKLGYLDPRIDFDELFDRMSTYVGFTPVNNVCGGPAIALPTPLGAHGMPGSVQFSAAWGDEATLLGLAYELEAARAFPDIRDGGVRG